jgi:acetyl-CoA carboxylase biotin carboxylase subunit
MFKRILVANRGEIALRIFRACRELGIEVVAVFSEADRGAAYLDLADEAYCIGPPKAADSYLKIDRIISAAEVGNVQAIHPGYGFLAENAHFAEVCRSCDIEFIGPSHEAMGMLGDKNMARKMARASRVPTVPGSEGLIETEAQAVQLAKELGFPVLIKASAGGGGRGMRVAVNELALKSALQQAQAEAEAAFGNAEIYLEKYVEHPRHVEVQVLADLHGNAVHLWERDCTMQRRHQKLIEESPAPQLDPKTRTAMCESAVRIVKAANYTNAGTVEFIVDRHGNYYFIEMNARIQVEHPVTELCTGIDLIKAQIAVASGEPLPFRQEDIKHHGVAIECRINAEDPDKNFRPTPGEITRLVAPGGFGVRFDSHVHAGYVVSPYYDSMIGKLIVHQPTRAEAIACMKRALRELRVEGIKTTVPIHQKILNHSAFNEARVDTTFIERTWTGAGLGS